MREKKKRKTRKGRVRRKKKTRSRRKHRGGTGEKLIILFLAHAGVKNGQLWEQWRGNLDRTIQFCVHAPPGIDDFSTKHNITNWGGEYIEPTAWCRESLALVFLECLQNISDKIGSGGAIVYLVSGVDIPICPAKFFTFFSKKSKFCHVGQHACGGEVKTKYINPKRPAETITYSSGDVGVRYAESFPSSCRGQQQWVAVNLKDFKALGNWRAKFYKMTKKWFETKFCKVKGEQLCPQSLTWYNMEHGRPENCPDEIFIASLFKDLITYDDNDWCTTAQRRPWVGASSPITWTSPAQWSGWNSAVGGGGTYIKTNWLTCIIMRLVYKLYEHLYIQPLEVLLAALRRAPRGLWNRTSSRRPGGIYFFFRKIGWTLSPENIKDLEFLMDEDKYIQFCTAACHSLWDHRRGGVVEFDVPMFVKITNHLTTSYRGWGRGASEAVILPRGTDTMATAMGQAAVRRQKANWAKHESFYRERFKEGKITVQGTNEKMISLKYLGAPRYAHHVLLTKQDLINDIGLMRAATGGLRAPVDLGLDSLVQEYKNLRSELYKKGGLSPKTKLLLNSKQQKKLQQIIALHDPEYLQKEKESADTLWDTSAGKKARVRQKQARLGNALAGLVEQNPPNPFPAAPLGPPALSAEERATRREKAAAAAESRRAARREKAALADESWAKDSRRQARGTQRARAAARSAAARSRKQRNPLAAYRSSLFRKRAGQLAHRRRHAQPALYDDDEHW